LYHQRDIRGRVSAVHTTKTNCDADQNVFHYAPNVHTDWYYIIVPL